MTVSGRAAAPWLLAALVLAALPVVFSERAALALLTQMAITAVFALSYNMLLGQGGMLSFGHAVYAGLGGYASVHLLNRAAEGAFAIPLPVLPLLAGGTALALAALVGLFSLRRAGTGFAMISLGIGELIAAAALIFVVFSGGEDGVAADRTSAPFLGIDFATPLQVYGLVAVFALAAALAMAVFTRTSAGALAQAVRDNPERVAHLGFEPAAIRYRTFCASAFFAGLAGGLFAITYEFAGPETLTLAASGQILLAAYLGGIGVFWGPVLGAIVFTLLQSVISVETGLWQLYLGLAFVATVLFCPRGLAGVLGDAIAPAGERSPFPWCWPLIQRWGGGILACLGAVGLMEFWHHRRQVSLGAETFTLFWVDLPHTGVAPWVLFGAIAVVGLVLCVRAGTGQP